MCCLLFMKFKLKKNNNILIYYNMLYDYIYTIVKNQPF